MSMYTVLNIDVYLSGKIPWQRYQIKPIQSRGVHLIYMRRTLMEEKPHCGGNEI